jgi:ribose transport system permease protein
MRQRWLRGLERRPETRIAIVFVVVMVILSGVAPGFSGSPDLTLGRAAADGLAALGLTAVIIQGELDLSVGSILALAGVLTIGLEPLGLQVAVPIALGAGIAIGLINGLLVTRGGISSFIATLGTMIAVRGLVFTYTKGLPISGSNLDASLAMAKPLVGFLTPRVLIFIVAAMLLQLFMSSTRIGRDFYAVGGNRDAALAAGIPVERRIWTGFMISGFLAAIAGVIVAVELDTGSPVLGTQTALVAITAVVIGGTSLLGGRGTILGTVLGELVLAALTTGLILLNVPSRYQQVITGALLVGVVLLDQMQARRPRWLRVTRWRNLASLRRSV